MSYQVEMLTGDYSVRQRKANELGAICYLEAHFNASTTSTASYTLVLVAHNGSEKSISWADYFSDLVSETFGINQGGEDGVLKTTPADRGDSNLSLTNMPAILIEPLFASNPEQAEIIVSGEGRNLLAQIITQSITASFPEGGLVGFSVGHKYKTSRPADRGAGISIPDPDPTDDLGHSEADYAEDVLLRAREMLENLC